MAAVKSNGKGFCSSHFFVMIYIVWGIVTYCDLTKKNVSGILCVTVKRVNILRRWQLFEL